MLDLEIPAGIKSGSFLKYAGRGDDGAGDVPSGDLYVKILVQDSAKYARKTDDLFDLVLGGEVEVPHPEGKMTVRIPK